MTRVDDKGRNGTILQRVRIMQAYTYLTLLSQQWVEKRKWWVF